MIDNLNGLLHLLDCSFRIVSSIYQQHIFPFVAGTDHRPLYMILVHHVPKREYAMELNWEHPPLLDQFLNR